MPSTPRYGLFPTEIDGRPGWVTVSMDWLARPDPSKATWLHIRFPFQPADAQGLPTPGAMEVINQVEDMIVPMLEEKLKAQHVGSISSGGARNVYFYAPSDRGMADALRLVAARFPAAAPGGIGRSDPQHQLFAELLEPDLGQFEFMKNAWVLEQLEQAGDDHAAPRMIEHFASFPTAEGREQFAGELPELDLALGEDAFFTEARDGAEAFIVKFTQHAGVEIFALSDLTAQLAQNAIDAGGEYEGWETEPVAKQ